MKTGDPSERTFEETRSSALAGSEGCTQLFGCTKSDWTGCELELENQISRGINDVACKIREGRAVLVLTTSGSKTAGFHLGEDAAGGHDRCLKPISIIERNQLGKVKCVH